LKADAEAMANPSEKKKSSSSVQELSRAASGVLTRIPTEEELRAAK
jgi:hypothetical protein